MNKYSGSKDLRRRKFTRQERPRILVVTEGKETERQYFEKLAKLARATGLDICTVQIIGLGRDPSRVVAEAIRRREEDQRLHGERDQYDEVFAVFDVDEHERLADAITMARHALITVAISNPCFELWLLWHFQDHFKYCSSQSLKDLLSSYGHEGKHLSASFPIENYREALRRSVQGRPDDLYSIPINPGSAVDRVVTSIAGVARP